MALANPDQYASQRPDFGSDKQPLKDSAGEGARQASERVSSGEGSRVTPEGAKGDTGGITTSSEGGRSVPEGRTSEGGRGTSEGSRPIEKSKEVRAPIAVPEKRPASSSEGARKTSEGAR